MPQRRPPTWRPPWHSPSRSGLWQLPSPTRAQRMHRPPQRPAQRCPSPWMRLVQQHSSARVTMQQQHARLHKAETCQKWHLRAAEQEQSAWACLCPQRVQRAGKAHEEVAAAGARWSEAGTDLLRAVRKAGAQNKVEPGQADGGRCQLRGPDVPHQRLGGHLRRARTFAWGLQPGRAACAHA